MSEETKAFPGIDDMLDPVNDEALMPISSLRIVRLIDSDGDEQVRIKFCGNESISATLGLLEYAKQALWQGVLGDVNPRDGD